MKGKGVLLMCVLFFIFWGRIPVQAANEITEDLIDKMELDEVQEMLDDMLGENSFSFSDGMKKIITGEEAFSKEAVQEFLRGLFFSCFQQERSGFSKILVLILFAAMLTGFGDVFESGQIGDVSFYMVYILLFTMEMDGFSRLCTELSKTLAWIASFMQVLSPAYFLSAAAASGGASAACFYEGILLLVWVIEWGLQNILLPGVYMSVVIRLVNHLSREEMLGKLAELLETGVNWGVKTILGLIAGFQIIKNMAAPVMDDLKRSLLGKTAGAIPGVGNGLELVTKLLVTSAVLVRNSLGILVLAALLLAGAGPFIRYGMMSIGYRFLAAAAQPVSDRRIVGCLSTMGEGCEMLLRLLLTTDILCMLTFVILAVSFGGGA